MLDSRRESQAAFAQQSRFKRERVLTLGIGTQFLRSSGQHRHRGLRRVERDRGTGGACTPAEDCANALGPAGIGRLALPNPGKGASGSGVRFGKTAVFGRPAAAAGKGGAPSFRFSDRRVSAGRHWRNGQAAGAPDWDMVTGGGNRALVPVRTAWRAAAGPDREAEVAPGGRLRSRGGDEAAMPGRWCRGRRAAQRWPPPSDAQGGGRKTFGNLTWIFPCAPGGC